jgi:asparagine N-glycosylation enzyme membrane subunit Stt3
MESAVGVLIYQMGIGSLAIFAIFVRLLWGAPFFRRKPQGRDVWFLALATVMVNGVFQEEAYAPTAAGLIALLCAVVLINEQRQAISLTRPAKLLARHTYA